MSGTRGVASKTRWSELGSAIGLERLAPLGAVTIGGLVVGTLMTLIFIPVGFVWLGRRSKPTPLFKGMKQAPSP
jgi:hypothetical protein